MGELITYEQFKWYQRKKKYGCNKKKLRSMGFPENLNFGPDEPSVEDPTAWLAQFINSESQDSEE